MSSAYPRIDLGAQNAGVSPVSSPFSPQDAKSPNASIKRASTMRATALYQGWLHKRGPNARFGWRKVWCLLLPEEMLYYSDERCWEKKGDVPFRPGTKVLGFKMSEVPGDGSSYAKEKPNGFVVDPGPPGTKRQLYYFDAIEEQAFQTWIEAIGGVIEGSKHRIQSFLFRVYAKAGARAEKLAKRALEIEDSLKHDGTAKQELELMAELGGQKVAMKELQAKGDDDGEDLEVARTKAAAMIQARHRGNKARLRCESIKAEQIKKADAKAQAGDVRAAKQVEETAPDAENNRAFIFIKPHAQFESVRTLIEAKLSEKAITIIKEGEITAAEIHSQKLVDKHYYSIASKATLLPPEKVAVPPVLFKENFDIEWAEALEKGMVKNAVDAAAEFGLDAAGIDAEWKKSSPVKLGGGFYCAKMTVGEKQFFVFNAFYMAMRAKFTAAGKSIYYYSVKWKPEDCSWKQFRADVIGSTNPAKAQEGSIRRTIYDQWSTLGLQSQPDVSDNGVHGSASPFEAMAERLCWLRVGLREDPFGQVLLTEIGENRLLAWTADPILYRQEGEITVFDQLEDLDAGTCMEKIIQLDEEAYALRDLVSVRGIEAPGRIRFLGPGHFAPGTWVGVELSKAEGKNDGSVKDVRYFTCPPKCGIFVRPVVVSKLPRENSKFKNASKKEQAAAVVRLQSGVRGRRARKQVVDMKQKVRQTDGLTYNRAFVFIKPHAQTEAVQKLVKQTLRDASISIIQQGKIAAEDIDKKKLVDQHYYAIASKATLQKPDQLPVPVAAFKEKFGEAWSDVLKDGRAANALQAAEAFGLDAAGLEAEWRKCDPVKFGGGFYCGKMRIGEKELYVFNAFFMAMRSKYIQKGQSIQYYSVKWLPSDCSWTEFRDAVIGATDPAEAAQGSIRRTILDKWKDLGLSAPPDKGDNGIHGSASPFEGLAERCNWLETAFPRDIFGAALLSGGMPEARLTDWAKDARIKIDREKSGSVFDVVENLDASQCCTRLLELSSLNSASFM